jgi:hypothetical protein
MTTKNTDCKQWFSKRNIAALAAVSMNTLQKYIHCHLVSPPSHNRVGKHLCYTREELDSVLSQIRAAKL